MQTRTEYRPTPRRSKVMNILAIDPGVTTGLAVLNEFGTVLASDNASEDELESKLNILVDEHMPEYVLIEEVGTPTLSELNQQLGRIKNFCKRFFPEAVWTKAADWKQTPAVKSQVPPSWNGKALTQHQKDSIRMGRWFLRFKLHTTR